MSRIIRPQIRCLAIALLLVSVPVWDAKPQSQAVEAPVPPLISSARRVFISNSGEGCTPFGHTGFSGGPNRPYNQFYAAMNSWGRYELVAAPMDAELDLAISFSCPAAKGYLDKGPGRL